MNKKSKKIIYALCMLLVITNVGTFFISKYIGVKLGNTVTLSEKEFKELSFFDELILTKKLIEDEYKGEVNAEKLKQGALRGLVASLDDKHSTYMTKQEYEDFNTINGEYAGIGIRIGGNDSDNIVINEVFKNTPANKNGLRPGDIIVSVDDVVSKWSESEKTSSKIKTKVGNVIRMTINRNGEILEKNITIEKVKTEPVSSEYLGDGVGYINLLEFDANSAENVVAHGEELVNKGAKGFIIDLRDNPGGLLTEVVEIVSQFVPKSEVIVTTKDKEGNVDVKKSSGGKFQDIPITVLVNGGSASASEVFAGVIKDYGRGKIVGKNTYGKGTVQTTYLLDEGKSGAIKLTIAKYYTSGKNDINKKGIKPDHEVEFDGEIRGINYKKEDDPQFNKALEIIKKEMK